MSKQVKKHNSTCTILHYYITFDTALSTIISNFIKLSRTFLGNLSHGIKRTENIMQQSFSQKYTPAPRTQGAF